MKQSLAIKLKFETKEVRRAVAMITGEAPSDEEIKKRFFDREPVEIDSEILNEQAFQICAAFVAFIIAHDHD